MGKEKHIGQVISVPAVFDTTNAQNFSQSTHLVKVYVAYPGDNRNYSSISKETFEKMIPTLYGAPVVGEFDEKTGDFKSHGEEIVITDDGVEYRKNTHAYGYIDSQAEVRWTKGVEKDNPEREYLTVDAYMWTDYFSQARRVLDGRNNQSMEIEILDGEYRDDDFFEITDARFLSLCILGEEVEPCFEGASVSKFEMGKKFNEANKRGVEMEERVQELEQQNEELTSERDELQKKVEELEKMIEDLEKKLGEEPTEDTQEENASLKTQLEEKEEAFAKLEKELSELKEFKANIELEEKTALVESTLEEFGAMALVEAEVMTEESFAELKEKAISEMEIVDLEKEISYMLVKHNIQPKKDKGEVFNLNTKVVETPTQDNPYGDLARFVK